jgi:hypothetical protein
MVFDVANANIVYADKKLDYRNRAAAIEPAVDRRPTPRQVQNLGARSARLAEPELGGTGWRWPDADPRVAGIRKPSPARHLIANPKYEEFWEDAASAVITGTGHSIETGHPHR